MNGVYTNTQLLAIINMVVSGYPGHSIDDRIYTLDEIVERTGWAKSTLEEELRAGTYDHTGKGRSIGMTPTQLARAIATFERKRKNAPGEVAVDELAKVREASRSAQNRIRPGRRQKASS